MTRISGILATLLLWGNVPAFGSNESGPELNQNSVAAMGQPEKGTTANVVPTLILPKVGQLNLSRPWLTATDPNEGRALDGYPLGIDFSRDDFEESLKPGPKNWLYSVPIQTPDFEGLKSYHLVVDTQVIRHLDMYLFKQGEILQKHALGVSDRLAPEKPYKGLVRTLSLEPNQRYELIFQKQSDGPGIIPVRIFTDEAEETRLLYQWLFWGVAIATLIALALYNTSVYFLYPGPAYGWYLVFHCIAFVYFAGLHGFGHLFMSAEVVNWIASNISTLNFCLVTVGTWLAAAFLEVKENAPKSAKVLPYLKVLLVTSLIVSLFIPEYSGIDLFFPVHIVVATYLIYMAIEAFKNGFSPALLFLISWMMTLIGGTVGICAYMDLIPANSITLHGFMVGTISELFFLSLALSHRLGYLEKRENLRAFFDEVTKLPNQSFFSHKLPIQIHSLMQPGQSTSMILFGVDGIREVGGVLGPSAISKSYRLMLDKFRKVLEDSQQTINFVLPNGQREYLIMMSEREFAVFMSGDNLGFIINAIQDEFESPLSLNNVEFRVRCHAGVVPMYLADTNVSQLYRQGQVALLSAVREGKLWNSYQFSQDEYIQDQVVLLSDLRKAVINEELDVYLQPQVDFTTGELLGAEVLSRWQHPLRGYISPSRFIELAEQSGLITDITKLVIQNAFNWLSDLQPLKPVKISINLSILDLVSDSLLKEIDRGLQTYEIDPNFIVFEITESIDMHNAEEVLFVIQELKYRGFQIAIDDFGTGYSSMAYLSKIRPDWIKIDRSFVKSVDQSPTHQVIIKAVVDMAKSLGAKTIAEGIESKSEAGILQRIGVQVAQGYYWSKPLTRSSFNEKITASADTIQFEVD